MPSESASPNFLDDNLADNFSLPISSQTSLGELKSPFLPTDMLSASIYLTSDNNPRRLNTASFTNLSASTSASQADSSSPRLTYEESWLRTSSPLLIPFRRSEKTDSPQLTIKRPFDTPAHRSETELRMLASPSPLIVNSRTPAAPRTSFGLSHYESLNALFKTYPLDDWSNHEPDISPVLRRSTSFVSYLGSLEDSGKQAQIETSGFNANSTSRAASFLEALSRSNSSVLSTPTSLSMTSVNNDSSWDSPLTPISPDEWHEARDPSDVYNPPIRSLLYRSLGRRGDFTSMCESGEGSTAITGFDSAESLRGLKRKLDEPESPTPRSRIKVQYPNHRSQSIAKSNSLLLASPKQLPSHVKTHDHSGSPSIQNRTFPGHVSINTEFPMFYRRFPLSSYFSVPNNDSIIPDYPGGTSNSPRDAFDIYTPRFVKGIGRKKMGLCPICCETVERGGENKKLWLYMKTSAFKCHVRLIGLSDSYHMQYAHGISVITALPFSPPLSFRTRPRHPIGYKERSELVEGKCHKCNKWIAIEGVKDVEFKVKEIYWWKHAAACHRGSSIVGEKDFYIEDDLFKSAIQTV